MTTVTNRGELHREVEEEDMVREVAGEEETGEGRWVAVAEVVVGTSHGEVATIAALRQDPQATGDHLPADP